MHTHTLTMHARKPIEKILRCSNSCRYVSFCVCVGGCSPLRHDDAQQTNRRKGQFLLAMPSQFDDAEDDVVSHVAAVPRPIQQQEAAKYGGLNTAQSAADVATKRGGIFPAYGQDRYTPVLPTELVAFGGLNDVYELSGMYDARPIHTLSRHTHKNKHTHICTPMSVSVSIRYRYVVVLICVPLLNMSTRVDLKGCECVCV